MRKRDVDLVIFLEYLRNVCTYLESLKFTGQKFVRGDVSDVMGTNQARTISCKLVRFFFLILYGWRLFRGSIILILTSHFFVLQHHPANKSRQI